MDENGAQESHVDFHVLFDTLEAKIYRPQVRFSELSSLASLEGSVFQQNRFFTKPFFQFLKDWQFFT